MRKAERARALVLALLVACAAGAQPSKPTAKQSAAELGAVRAQIKALESRLAKDAVRRDASARALRDAELEVAAAERKLADVRKRLAAAQAERRTVAARSTRAGERLAAERAALAEQVRAAYMNGGAEVLKLLLSQESPATLGRMLAYYDYFNRARSARIAAVSAELTELGELERENERLAADLAGLAAAQDAELASLAAARDERAALVAKLEQGIASGTAEIAKLRADEKRLAELVAKLQELAAGFPVDNDQPFARLKGKLAWPVRGRLAGDYGQPRGGGSVKWNGVLLEAEAGTAVRAIYQGRVAFADWLPGLGLLIIVDHGGGYMSLYGHNAALLKESGDSVAAGEPLAEVGDTGGLARPALYFEIRQAGEPQNPHLWIAKSPPR